MAMGLNALVSMPIRADPFSYLTSSSHGSGPVLYVPFSTFLHPARPHRYLIFPAFASSRLVQTERNSQQRPRRRPDKDSPFRSKRSENGRVGGKEDGLKSGWSRSNNGNGPSGSRQFSRTSTQPKRQDSAGRRYQGRRPFSERSKEIMEEEDGLDDGVESRDFGRGDRRSTTQSHAPWHQERRQAMDEKKAVNRGVERTRLAGGGRRSSMRRQSPWHQERRPFSDSSKRIMEGKEDVNGGVESTHFAGGGRRSSMRRQAPWHQERRPYSDRSERIMEEKEAVNDGVESAHFAGGGRRSSTMRRQAPWHQEWRPYPHSSEQFMEEKEAVNDGVESTHFAGGERRTTMRRQAPWHQEGRRFSDSSEQITEEKEAVNDGAQSTHFVGGEGRTSMRRHAPWHHEGRRFSDSSEQIMEEKEAVNDGVQSTHFAGGERKTSMRRQAPWHEEGRRFSDNSEQIMEEKEAVNDGGQSTHFAGGEGRTSMQRIIEKLRKINKSPEEPKVDKALEHPFRRTPGSIFLPKRGQDLFSISKGWSTPDHPVPEPGKSILDARFPWEREQEVNPDDNAEKVKRVKPPSMAELTVPQPELRRLRMLSLRLMHRIKVGRLGVTDTIVDMIHEKWRDSEVVKVKCDGPPALNMKKTHEDLERKTGGLVIWRAGSVAVIYRGKDYNLEKAEPQDQTIEAKLENLIWSEKAKDEFLDRDQDKLDDAEKPNDVDGQGTSEGVNHASRDANPFDDLDEEYELEVENILAELGPRYEEWPGRKPTPVDADLLPVHIPDYKPPFRLLPYGVKPNLSNSEMTNLRRLARPLPPHFALGRNKGQHGLAVAMVKLWEKSEVAKIFVKRGVQNTNNERMAEELKRLTGAVLLSRDKFYITLYRGKDFLPKAVAAALAEREAMAKALQEEEERARAETSIPILADNELKLSTAGTLAGTLEARATWEKWMDSEEQQRLRLQAAKAKRLEQARRIERKLDVALKKKTKAQKELEKVEVFLRPSDPPLDRETITEEERFMFRKLGLKMKAFLLIGRRGVFDGVVENMHLHWKHRELVKIIFKERDPAVIEETARMLEYESGGILVAVVATSKGQAIIVYRGKNYQRPPQLRPKNLLTKRKALKRSMEIQRRESLNRHILALEKEIDRMKEEMSKMEEVKQAEAVKSLKDNDDADNDDTQEDSEELVLKHANEEIPGSSLAEDTQSESMEKLSDHGTFKSSRANRFFKAEPLTNREKLKLRKQALTLGKAAHFHVGKGNVLGGLVRAIRAYFRKHALVKIGVKGRARGTAIQELVHALEEATGGVLVSQEYSKIILYRGWPDGEDMPSSDFDEEEMSMDLLAAMEEEDGYTIYGESDDESDDEIDDHDLTNIDSMLSDEEGFQDDNDSNGASALLSDPEDDEESDGNIDDINDGESYESLEEVTEEAIEAYVTDIETLLSEPEEDENSDVDSDNYEEYEYQGGGKEETREVNEVDSKGTEEFLDTQNLVTAGSHVDNKLNSELKVAENWTEVR